MAMYNILAVVPASSNQDATVGKVATTLSSLGMKVRARASTQKAGAVTIRVKDTKLRNAQLVLDGLGIARKA